MTILAIETPKQAILVVDLPTSYGIPMNREDLIAITTRTLSTVIREVSDQKRLQISAYGYDCHLNGLFVRFFSTDRDETECKRLVDHLYSAFGIKPSDEIKCRKSNDLKSKLWRILPAPNYVPT